MVSTAGTTVSVLLEWRFPNAGLRGHRSRNIQKFSVFILYMVPSHNAICTVNIDLLYYTKTAAEKSTAVRKTAICISNYIHYSL